jgi:hypothetical protein
MPSARYTYLKGRLAELRKRLLPKVFSATGSYNMRQYDKVRAYRLLAHAEVESYLEDRARTVAATAYSKWQVDHRPRSVLISLLAFHLQQEELSAQKLKEVLSGVRQHTEDSVKSATQAYNKMLSNNNGIKEENVLRILLPLGIEAGDIDSTWLRTIHDFGKQRGETAHTSIRTQQPPDPESELRIVSDIVGGLKNIDQQLK